MTPPGTKEPRWCLLRIQGEASEGMPDALLGGELLAPMPPTDGDDDGDGAERVALRVIALQVPKEEAPKKGRAAAAPPPKAAVATVQDVRALSKVDVAVDGIEYTYAAAFWGLFARFFSAVEAEMQQSPAMATSPLRAKYPKMLRGLSEHLRRPWWTGDVKGLTGFVSSAALLTSANAGFPLLRVRLLRGVALQLDAALLSGAERVQAEKYPVADTTAAWAEITEKAMEAKAPADGPSTPTAALMTMTVPPIEIQRAPKPGGDAGEVEVESSVRFAEQIVVASPRADGLLSRLISEGAVARGTIPLHAEQVLLNCLGRFPVDVPPAPQLAPPATQTQTGLVRRLGPGRAGPGGAIDPTLPPPQRQLSHAQLSRLSYYGDGADAAPRSHGHELTPRMAAAIFVVGSVALVLLWPIVAAALGRNVEVSMWIVAAPYPFLLAIAAMLLSSRCGASRPPRKAALYSSREMM